MASRGQGEFYSFSQATDGGLISIRNILHKSIGGVCAHILNYFDNSNSN